ncbi:MAG: taurine dioxygenase [Alphaproteobacteria bacterium]|jgi:taurine dioxygenase
MTMTTSTEIQVTPLSPACGAEVSGLDLSQDLPQTVIDQVTDAWHAHQMLVIRGQDVTLEQQLRFAGRFGELGERKQAPDALRERTEGILQTDKHTLLVSNMVVDGKPVGAFGDGDMWYHIDSGYAESPYKYTFLYGMELPSSGGNTLFANTYMAYETLPQDLKNKIEGRMALHIHEYKRSEKVDISGDISNSPHWFHPVVIRHPETGRKALFVDRLMTRRIEGLDPEESESVLNQLFDHAENPKYVYEHVWQLKDLVMWDNRCLIHGRTWFPKEENRLLRRCTVEGGPLAA